MHHLTSKLAPTHSLLSIFSHFRSNPNHQTMSGFSYYNGQSPDAPSLHNSSFVQVSSTLQREMINTECFQGVPFHFQSAEVNAACSIVETEVPLPGIVCGLNKRNEDDLNADTGVTVTTQMPKKRMKSSSKVALRKNEEKKTKASKIENEGQSPGTPEIGYVHVRARRGQATDSHSLAERVRREKIGERMKLLQSLVPGCDKIAGKTQVLDEIINYVQSLQTQLQILAGKLSILSPYARDYENSLEGIAPSATTTEGSIRWLDASLSCMMESSCNLLHFHDDTQHNSIVSSSSPSLTSQGDQKYSLSQDTEVLLRENDVQGLHISTIDQYWLDHFAQLK